MDVESTKISAEEMNALLKRMGGEAGLQRFLRGELALVEAEKRDFPVWKTLRLGAHKTAADYSKALKAGANRSGDWVLNYLGQPAFQCARQETDVDLTLVSVGDLGFEKGALYSQVVERALALGLELCPAEVGPALRLAYGDQPRGERLIIATKPSAESGADLDLFVMEVSGGGGLWLRGDCGPSDRYWETDRRFVFVRPKKS
jgi:hypothetical protein